MKNFSNFYLSRRHLARLFCVHPRTIDRWGREGRLILRRHSINNRKIVFQDEIEFLNDFFHENHWYHYEEFNRFKEVNYGKNFTK